MKTNKWCYAKKVRTTMKVNNDEISNKNNRKDGEMIENEENVCGAVKSAGKSVEEAKSADVLEQLIDEQLEGRRSLEQAYEYGRYQHE